MSRSALLRRCGALLFLLALAAPLHARVWYVNAGSASQDGNSFTTGFHTITQGMNATASGDQVWVEKGNYTEHVLMSTQRALYGGFTGTETSQSQADPVANQTIITGSGAPLGGYLGSCIGINFGSMNVVIDGFLIRDGTGHKDSSGGGTRGGGIFADDNCQFTVTRCTFRTNHSVGTSVGGGATAINGYGGAIYYTGFQTPIITDNTFIDNDAYLGGALYMNDGNAIIQRNTFSFNAAGGNGGAIVANGGRSVSFLVTDNTFNNNAAQNGAALYMPSADKLICERNSLVNNTAGQNGGAVYLDGATNSTVRYNVFNGDKAGAFGGGVYCDGSNSVEVSGNVLFLCGINSGGGVTPHGGGIFDVSSIVVNNTIVSSAKEAIRVAGSGGVVYNNIVYSNDTGISAVSPMAATLRNNDVVGNTTADYSGIGPGAGDVSVNPAFVDEAHANFHLQPSSPCVDAGDSVDGYVPPYDYDGDHRPIGPSVDIGADEVLETLVFTTQPGNGTPNHTLNVQPVVTVQDAAGATRTAYNGPVAVAITGGTGTAGAALGGTTTVDAVDGVAAFTNLSVDKVGLNYQLTASAPGFAAVNSATFDVLLSHSYVRTTGNDLNDGSSWAAAKKTIHAALAATGGPVGQVWVAKGTYTETETVQSGVTLFGGFLGNETSLEQRDFHANVTTIHATSGHPCVVFVSSSGSGVDGFSLTGGTGYPISPIFGGVAHTEGGGVYCSASTAVIAHNVITGNTATDGGGISVSGGGPIIRYNTISANVALAKTTIAGAGGGISLSQPFKTVVADNFIVGNSAQGETSSGSPSVAGAMVLDSGTPDIHNNTFVANASPKGSGDIYLSGGAPVFTNNIIQNKAAIQKLSGAPVFSHNDYIPGAAVASQLPNPAGTNGNISVAATFVNAAAGDYHLPADSFLLNQGDNSVVLKGETDVDGDARIIASLVDIGADEVVIPPYTIADAVTALGITGGLQTASASDASRLNVELPAGIDILDTMRILRKATQLDGNP